jgi:hypothetical protein
MVFQVFLDVDIHSKCKNKKPKFEKHIFYGRVEYFLLHTYQNQNNMLAYVQWTGPVQEDKYNLNFFSRMGGYEFIEVRSIDRCVAFCPIGNKTYVLDIEDDASLTEK